MALSLERHTFGTRCCCCQFVDSFILASTAGWRQLLCLGRALRLSAGLDWLLLRASLGLQRSQPPALNALTRDCGRPAARAKLNSIIHHSRQFRFKSERWPENSTVQAPRSLPCHRVELRDRRALSLAVLGCANCTFAKIRASSRNLAGWTLGRAAFGTRMPFPPASQAGSKRAACLYRTSCHAILDGAVMMD